MNMGPDFDIKYYSPHWI